ncbi:Hsp20/alpha crystallin family protein [Kitasatospora xanthocidica]|uniref:Hsp20/alpha crystallin family protein n=1 Tax=Kitasatospora xanthocidica TaxID=83382 RepID=A0A372ZNM3_9ACTN|nr:Hsp20/alpha crystallin family protein [Kitasatospora xanthocidica]RGD56855.1 Hsp20/alpha crystallin family protein [Kitasatospora xanthocidica]
MLLRTDPFRELDRLTQQFLNTTGTWSRPTPMPLDAYRAGDEYVICFDLPGVDPEAIDIDVERNMVTVKAERRPRQDGEGIKWELSERPLGVFSRQVMLSDTLDPAGITADYDAGVLTLKIPVAEKAKPRKIEISHSGSRKQIQA